MFKDRRARLILAELRKVRRTQTALVTHDPQQNLFFVNFERFSVRSVDEIRAIVKAVENKLAPLGHRVYAIVNYDNFSILPELLDEYSAAVRGLVDLI